MMTDSLFSSLGMSYCQNYKNQRLITTTVGIYRAYQTGRGPAARFVQVIAQCSVFVIEVSYLRTANGKTTLTSINIRVVNVRGLDNHGQRSHFRIEPSLV